MKEVTVAEEDLSVRTETRSTTHSNRNKYKVYNNPLIIEEVAREDFIFWKFTRSARVGRKLLNSDRANDYIDLFINKVNGKRTICVSSAAFQRERERERERGGGRQWGRQRDQGMIMGKGMGISEWGPCPFPSSNPDLSLSLVPWSANFYYSLLFVVAMRKGHSKS